MKEVILLIDADSMLWQSSFCKKEEDPEGEGYVRELDTAMWKFEEGFHRIFNHMDEIGKPVSMYKVFVQGDNNFRKIVNPQYKINRVFQKKPPIYDELVGSVTSSYNAFTCNGVETDDVVAATWKALVDTDFDDSRMPIIVSMDKDYKQLPNLDFFDYYYTRFGLTHIDKLEAFKNLMMQMLMGDKADGVDGIKGVGKKGADKSLSDCSSQFGLLKSTYAMYIAAYGKRKAYKEWVKNYAMLKLHTDNVVIPEYPFGFEAV